MKIAVIDKELSSAQFISRALNNEEFTEYAKGYCSLISAVELALYDIILMDTEFNNQILDTVKQINNKIKFVFMSSIIDLDVVSSLYKKGASGFIPKQVDSDEFIGAIRKVTNDQIYFSSELDTLSSLKNKAPLLTNKEIEVLRLLSCDLPNEKICEKLFISYSTFKTHRRNIKKKFSIENNEDLKTLYYSIV